jgi:hypothetical protein
MGDQISFLGMIDYVKELCKQPKKEKKSKDA